MNNHDAPDERILHDARWTFIRDRAIAKSLLYASAEQAILSPRGARQAWMLDLRRIMLEPEVIALVAELFWEKMQARFPFQIAGMETAAIPLITAIQLCAHAHGKSVNGVIVRKERKTYGLGRVIEGEFNDAPVIVVDDIVNSANSLEKLRVIFVDLGLPIREVFSIVDYQSSHGLHWRVQHQIPLTSLFLPDDLNLALQKIERPQPGFVFADGWKYSGSGVDVFSVVPKSSPVSDGRHVFFGDDGGVMHAVRIDDGMRAWSFDALGSGRKGIRSTPLLHQGRLYLGAYNGCLYCLEADSGREIWRFSEADWIGSSPVLSPRHNLIFIGTEYALPGRKGGILAVNASTGQRVWEHATKNYVHCTPCLDTEEAWLACGDNDGNLLCLDAMSGSLRWQYRAGGAIKAAPVYDAARRQILAAGFDGAVHIVCAATGELNWKFSTNGLLYTTPLISADKLLVGSTDKNLYVVDLNTRSVERKIPLDGKIFAQAQHFAGAFWLGTTGGKLYAINDTTWLIESVLQLPDRIVNTILPLPERAMLVVPTCDNKLFAFSFRKMATQQQQSAPQAEPLTLTAPPEYAPKNGDIHAAMLEGMYFRISDKHIRAEINNFPFLPSRRLLGAAVSLFAASAAHRELSIAQIEEMLRPAIQNGQLRLFLYGVRPFGLVIWAYPSEDAAQKLLSGEARLNAAEWNRGTDAWLIDVIAPFGGGNDMVAKVRRDILARQALTVVRRSAEGDAVIEQLPPLVAP